jgi:hypothetical protein
MALKRVSKNTDLKKCNVCADFKKIRNGSSWSVLRVIAFRSVMKILCLFVAAG